eukprot:115718_1
MSAMNFCRYRFLSIRTGPCLGYTRRSIQSSSNSTSSVSNVKKKSKVKIVEVGPRDGLQNETKVLSPRTKVHLVQKLVEAGCKHIETASFVSPKWVPAMASSSEVMTGLHEWRLNRARGENDKNDPASSTVFSVLTPNIKGFEDAMNCGKGVVDEVAIFAAASESFSQKNLGCSIDSSIEKFAKVTEKSKEYGIPVRGYVSCVMGCPYEENIEVSNVVRVAERLMELGCHEISLGDTIGVGTLEQTIQLLTEVKMALDKEMIAVHFHDTYGQALANIYAALGEGIRTIDSSVAGLGGCPYAAGASGNVATEDVVYMLNGMGLECGIDLPKLVQAGEFILDELDKESNSKCGIAIAAKLNSFDGTGKVCA